MKTLFAILLLSIVSFGQIAGPGSITTSPANITSNGAASPTSAVVNVSFTHLVLSQANPLLVVECAKNTYIATKVTGVSVNGTAMVLDAQLKGSPKATDTSVWHLAGVPAGVANISVTSEAGATHGYGVGCIAEDFYGVDQLQPVELADSDNIPANQPTASCTVTPQQAGDVLAILEYSTAYNQSAPMSATPFSPDIETGRYFGLQLATAHSGPLSAGVAVTETWTSHNSTTSVEWSIVGLLLKAQQ